MKNHGEICNHNQLQQRQQNIGAVARNDGRDKTENTEGGKADDAMHNLDAHFAHAVHEVGNGLGLLARSHNAEAEDKGNHDNLQHRGVSHRLDDVCGENVHDRVDERGGFLRFIRKLLGRQAIPAANVEDIRHNQADDNGECRRGEVVDNRFAADGANALDVGQRNDASGHRENDQRNDDHLNKVQENRAERLNVRGGKFSIALKRDTGHNAQRQRNKDPRGERESLIPGQILLRFGHFVEVMLGFFAKIAQLRHWSPLSMQE